MEQYKQASGVTLVFFHLDHALLRFSYMTLFPVSEGLLEYSKGHFKYYITLKVGMGETGLRYKIVTITC